MFVDRREAALVDVPASTSHWTRRIVGAIFSVRAGHDQRGRPTSPRSGRGPRRPGLHRSPHRPVRDDRAATSRARTLLRQRLPALPVFARRAATSRTAGGVDPTSTRKRSIVFDDSASGAGMTGAADTIDPDRMPTTASGIRGLIMPEVYGRLVHSASCPINASVTSRTPASSQLALVDAERSAVSVSRS